MTPRRTYPGVGIRTDYDPKPIPDRRFDWAAWDDSSYEGDPSDPLGYGACEADAIDDLLDQIAERMEP